MVVKQGDIIFIDAEPHAGEEQGGHDPDHGNIRRPAVVLSNDSYNQITPLVIIMPITSSTKAYSPTLLVPLIDKASGVKGYVVTIQVQCFAFKARHGVVVGHVSSSLLKLLLKRAIDNLTNE